MTEARVEEGSMLPDDLDIAPLIGVDGGLLGPARRLVRRRSVTLGALLAVALLACVLPVGPAGGGALQGDAKAEVGLFAPLAAVAMAAQGGAAAMHYLPMLREKVEAPFQKVRVEVLNSKPLNLSKYSNLTAWENLPSENLHDGNVCADDEEELSGLCYKKCAELTGGVYKIRTTAWSCCKKKPCTFFNSKFTNPLGLCGGFDVSGNKEGKACPHPKGTCLVNEEFSLGMCLKKCAVLTNNKFPYRSAASTCCRYNSHWACLDALNTQTSPNFNVGGGGSDGNPATPTNMHMPMPQLAEA